MKRPLLILAVVLVLGITIIHKRGGAYPFGLCEPPLFRTEMEKAQKEEAYECFSGKVEEITKKDTGYVLKVKADSRYGSVLVYTDEFSVDWLLSTVSFRGTFFLFSKATNPGEFSLRDYYDKNGIYLGFHAFSIEIEEKSGESIQKSSLLLRMKMENLLETYAPSDYGYFHHILFSDTAFLAPEEKKLYDSYGLYAVLSQVGFFLSFFGNRLYRFLKKKIGYRSIAGIITSLFYLGYGFLTTFSFSFYRAIILFLFQFAADLFKRKYDPLSAYSFLIILLLLKNPNSLFLPTLSYYFALIAGSSVFTPILTDYLQCKNIKVNSFIRLLCLQCAFLPIGIYERYMVNPYQLFLQPLFFLFRMGLTVLIWIGMALLLLIPGGGGLVSTLFLRPAHWIYEINNFLLASVGKLPLSEWIRGKPSEGTIFLYYFLLFSFFYFIWYQTEKRIRMKETKERMKRKNRWVFPLGLSFIYILGTLFLKAPGVSKGELQIIVFDVGQGDGFLLRTSDHAIFIDGGSLNKKNIGEILQNGLCYFGIDTINDWYISHPDMDHCNGFTEILTSGNISVKSLHVTEKAFREKTKNLNAVWEKSDLSVFSESAGNVNTYGDLICEVLYPEKSGQNTGESMNTGITENETSENDNSLILGIHFDDLSMLFTGDISSKTETKLSFSEYTLLKVAHHGSKYSTSEDFLREVRPKLAVISYGRNNTYGHPGKETLERLSKYTNFIEKTGETGAFQLIYKENTLQKMVFFGIIKP